MRLLAFLLLLAAVPAAAQLPSGALEAIRRDFPLDHRAISASIAGKAPDEARRLAYAGVDRFLRGRRDSILGAPGDTLAQIEAWQGAMLRSVARRDVRLCAALGDRGFFSGEAAAGAAPPGIEVYGAKLVEAARTGAGTGRAATLATREDLEAWLALVDRIEPGVPVRAMLSDRELRARSSPDHLCRGAAAMHEAVASLPSDRRERVARTLLRSVIGAAAE
jgi:hypothetical protein